MSPLLSWRFWNAVDFEFQRVPVTSYCVDQQEGGGERSVEEEEEEKSGGESEEKNVIVRHVPLARPHLTPALQHCPRLGEGRRGAGGPHTAVLLAAGSTHLVHHIDSRYISQRCGRHPSLFCGGAHPLEPGSPNSRAVLGMRRGSRRVSLWHSRGRQCTHRCSASTVRGHADRCN